MKLPYHPSIPEPSTPMATAGLTEEEFFDYYDAMADQTTDAILAAMTTDVSSIHNCVGACLIETTVHGYGGQALAVQYHDGTFLLQRWSEVSEAVETQSAALDLDLRVEISRLRQDGQVLRQHDINRNVDGNSRMEGRDATIYIVVQADAEWVSCPYLLKGGEYEDNAVNRILRAVYQMGNDVTLV